MKLLSNLSHVSGKGNGRSGASTHFCLPLSLLDSGRLLFCKSSLVLTSEFFLLATGVCACVWAKRIVRKKTFKV